MFWAGGLYHLNKLCHLSLAYNILSKILTNRLSKWMNDIINPFQNSGSSNRDIINNILNIQTILEYVNQNNEDLAIISIENEKNI